MERLNYLTQQDYLPWIQTGQMTAQLLDALRSGSIERSKAEQTAIETIYENLSQRYDLDKEFTPTLPYDPAVTYKANARITIDFPAWAPPPAPDGDNVSQYNVNDCVVQGGYGWQCLIANADQVFVPGNWLRLGLQYAIHYVPQPARTFLLDIGQQTGSKIPGLYRKGDTVFWCDHTYTALQSTPVLSQSDIQLLTYANQPHNNVFPDDLTQGSQYWLDNGLYTIDANTPPCNPAWTCGDNRSQKILMNVIDLALFWLHKRITPNNIPEVRFRAYDDVKRWLKESKDADIKPLITPLQPTQGTRIMGGSDVKIPNAW